MAALQGLTRGPQYHHRLVGVSLGLLQRQGRQVRCVEAGLPHHQIDQKPELRPDLVRSNGPNARTETITERNLLRFRAGEFSGGHSRSAGRGRHGARLPPPCKGRARHRVKIWLTRHRRAGTALQ